MVNEIDKQMKQCKSNCNIWIDENRYKYEVSKCICFKSKFVKQCQYCMDRLEYGFDDVKNLGIYKNYKGK